MNFNTHGRMQAWPSLRYRPGLCLEGLRETTKSLKSGWPVSGPRFESGTFLNTTQEYFPLVRDLLM
jgi:hypothetical protein